MTHCGDPGSDDEPEASGIFHPVPPPLADASILEAFLATDFVASDGTPAGRVKLLKAEWLCDAEKRHGAVPAYDQVPADACAEDEVRFVTVRNRS